MVSGLGAAVAGDGSVYYETMDHQLAVRRPGGAVTTGPSLAATPNGLGGGVQYVDAVASDVVWVSEPAGQGLDAQFSTYDGARSAPVGSYRGVVTATVVDTAAGALAFEQSDADTTCPQPAPNPPKTSCVLRIDAHGTTSDPVGVGAAVVAARPGPGGRRVGHGDRAIRPGAPVLSARSHRRRELGWAISSAWPRRRWG